MIYKFTIISNEVENFIRCIEIDSDATFYDLHKAILDACQYTDNQLTSFVICDAEWEREQEILLEDMGTTSSEEDLYLMRDTRLGELIEDESQRLAYVFDVLAERMLFLELSEIAFGRSLEKAVCTRSHGNAPRQQEDIEEILSKEPIKQNEAFSEDFYGSEDFDNDEFDPEGFEISDGDPFQ